jgi:hypothetical protein
MKLSIDKSRAVLLTLVVTYTIALGVLLIERRSAETALEADAPTTIVDSHGAPARPVGPGRPKTMGQPGRGMRPQQRDPASN